MPNAQISNSNIDTQNKECNKSRMMQIGTVYSIAHLSIRIRIRSLIQLARIIQNVIHATLKLLNIVCFSIPFKSSFSKVKQVTRVIRDASVICLTLPNAACGKHQLQYTPWASFPLAKILAEPQAVGYSTFSSHASTSYPWSSWPLAYILCAIITEPPVKSG